MKMINNIILKILILNIFQEKMKNILIYLQIVKMMLFNSHVLNVDQY